MSNFSFYRVLMVFCWLAPVISLWAQDDLTLPVASPTSTFFSDHSYDNTDLDGSGPKPRENSGDAQIAPKENEAEPTPDLEVVKPIKNDDGASSGSAPAFLSDHSYDNSDVDGSTLQTKKTEESEIRPDETEMSAGKTSLSEAAKPKKENNVTPTPNPTPVDPSTDNPATNGDANKVATTPTPPKQDTDNNPPESEMK